MVVPHAALTRKQTRDLGALFDDEYLAEHGSWNPDRPFVRFGYLGCREEVVPFYERAGWQRIEVTERHVSIRDPGEIVIADAGPILIFPTRDLQWPPGDIDLHGTPW